MCVCGKTTGVVVVVRNNFCKELQNDKLDIDENTHGCYCYNSIMFIGGGELLLVRVKHKKRD